MCAGQKKRDSSMPGYITNPEHELSLGFSNYLMLTLGKHTSIYRTHNLQGYSSAIQFSSILYHKFEKTGPFRLMVPLAKVLTRFHHIPDSKCYHHISLRLGISICNRCEPFQSFAVYKNISATLGNYWQSSVQT